MKPLRLHHQHLKLGAHFRGLGSWEVPTSFGDVVTEHRAVRTGVGIADLSHRGRIRVTGEDRVKWLQSIISNDILPLKPGQGVYSSLLTHKGKMLSYFRVYPLPDSIWVEDVGDIGDTTFQALRKFLLYGTKAKMEQATESWGLLLVSGPRAAELIGAAFKVDANTLEALPLLNSLGTAIGSHHALLIRTEETGELDIGVLIPVDGIVTAWERLWETGAPIGLKPIGSEAREILRIEAGLPRAGMELGEEIVPPEANLEGKAFSLTKGCYPGQEVVARMDTYGSVRRRLVGLVLKDSTLPPKGTKLFSGDREVGWITSAAHSPQLGRPVALGFPLRDFAVAGTILTLQLDEGRHEATVQALPFYSRS
jgi:folate-binding protein YgfZ